MNWESTRRARGMYQESIGKVPREYLEVTLNRLKRKWKIMKKCMYKTGKFAESTTQVQVRYSLTYHKIAQKISRKYLESTRKIMENARKVP